MFRHIRSLVLVPVVGALAACAPFGQTAQPTPIASGPTIIIVTATPAPATAVPPTAVPATAVPPTVVPATPVPAQQGVEQRIEFAPTNVSANTSGVVRSGIRDRYILRAKGGQQMHIAVNSIHDNGVFTVYGPDGQLLPGTEESANVASWSGPLALDGDYVVSVGAISGNATYEIKFTITDPLPAAVGSISGRLNYPSEYVPAQLIYAVRADDPSFFYMLHTNDGDSGYTMSGMRPGTYYIMSYPASDPDGTLRSAYTQHVLCGQQPLCVDHGLVPVTIFAEQPAVGAIDVIDWYSLDGAIPNRPQGEPQPR